MLVAAPSERDQDAELYLEGELIDTSAGKAVLRVVRKGFGKTLRNDSTDLKPLIDEFTTEVLRSCRGGRMTPVSGCTDCVTPI